MFILHFGLGLELMRIRVTKRVSELMSTRVLLAWCVRTTEQFRLEGSSGTGSCSCL
jgi:hypothetical protein